MHARSLISAIVLATLAGPLFGPSASATQGAFTFHVTVSGKARDSGTISGAVSGNSVYTVTGCAIIKQQPKSLFGAYIYEVRKFTGPIGVQQTGVKPTGPGVLLEADHFRPGASTSTYKYLDVSGTFAINGRSYGGGATTTSTIQISDGGRSGTWTEPHAHRNYPAKSLQAISGFSFRATWHCSSVVHLTQPKQ
jgi:hypothetical protein